ncbi:chemotaxis protein CheW [Paenibacillus oryzae]|uniref:Chemotaxis protein CheW n=1 Tax=Paenibacillus oryzae TaxID=1844972 RepID=A0A1A5YCW1_9BACL|nr:chemotaxis protein CheW [Paenibacillus oryzae]OBR63235.1 chemotaxis protein CheW [Paenibacillus oryzae]
MSETALTQYVQFGIGNESYAIKIAEVHEIITMQDITEIPNCQFYVKGVINLRGKIIPVISLRSLFSLQDQPYSKATRIIVVHHQEEAVGLIVDRVHKVARYEDIQPPLERIGGINGAYFTGIGVSDKELVGILKIDEVLLRK